MKNKSSQKQPFWTPQVFTAIAANVIALSALAYTIYSGYLQQKHQLLGVQPLFVATIDLENENTSGAGLFLQNVGLGPGIIQDCRLKINGKVFRHFRFGPSFGEVVGEQGIPWKTSIPLPMTPMSPGEKLLLFGIPLTELTKERTSILHKVMHSVTVEVDYASIYGDAFKGYIDFDSYMDGPDTRNTTINVKTAGIK